MLGRTFLPEEESKGDVVMVTENFWRKRLNSDPNVLGRSITLNGVPNTIIGVLANLPISWFGRDTEVFANKLFEPADISKDRLMRGVSFMRVIARLKPGETIQQAEATMPALQQGYREERPENADNSWASYLVPIAEDVTGNLRPAFMTLLAAVSAVLLIACSNVANLLLVRFTGRRREIALRMAVGGQRSSIVRLFVLESTLVSVIAGVAGLCLALWTVSVVPHMAGQNVPLESGVSLHLPVLVFTLALSLITGLLMGLYPAWQSSRADLIEGLKEGGGGTTGGGHRQHRLRRGLVAAQVGLSVALVASAAMLISSFVRLSRQESGFRPERIWAGGIALPPARYPDAASQARFVQRLTAELQNEPGVEVASVTGAVPLSGDISRAPYARVDGNPMPLTQRPLGITRSVSPNYFRTLSIPLVSGRDFSERDGVDQPLVVILSKATAKKLFPNEDPLGHRILFGTDNGTGAPAEVVGIVGDVRSADLAKVNDVEFYRPWAQRSSPFLNVLVRSTTKPEATTGIVRLSLKKIDDGLPIIQPNTLEAIVSDSLGDRRLTMALLGVFAGIALLLAVVGIYGAVAYTVEQRTSEIGVRMALGAQTIDVLRLVVRQGMNPVILGLIVGLTGTFVVGRLLAAQLYQISPHDPFLLGAAATVLAVAALLACLLPARRATRIDPIQALRSE
jgi:putative ABC transport system permease protein